MLSNVYLFKGGIVYCLFSETRNFFEATYTDCVTCEKISEDGHSAEASETVAENHQRTFDFDEMSFKKQAICGKLTSRIFRNDNSLVELKDTVRKERRADGSIPFNSEMVIDTEALRRLKAKRFASKGNFF
jgi:hypothetical protein